MFSKVNSFRFVAALIVALLMITGLQSGASAATKRKLGVTASPAVSAVGTWVKFSGKLSKSPKGSPVILKRKSGNKWIKVRTTRTSTKAGHYSVRVVRPKKVGNYYYRLTAPKRGNLRATNSRVVKVVALKRTLVSLSSTTASPTAGMPADLSGTVLPAIAGTRVTLQRQVNSSWVYAGATRVKADGTFATSAVPAGPTTYRAVVARAKAYAPGTSNYRKINARPQILTTALPDVIQSSEYSVQLKTYANAVGTWSANPLPAGLTINQNTGLISGTTSADPTNIDVKIRFTQAKTGLKAAEVTPTLRVRAAAAPVIETDDLADGKVNVAYEQQLRTVGSPPGEWSASPLPPGLRLEVDKIVGTPTAQGDTNVVIGFTSNTGVKAQSKTLTLRIDPVDKPVITTSNLPNGTRATPYQFQLTAAGNPVGTWTATPLPNGLSLNPATGLISGTPNAVGSTDVVIGFTQTNTGGVATSKTLSLRIDEAQAPVITTASLPDGQRYRAYSTQLTAEGNPSGTWTATGLPANGLSLNPNTGVISGTPPNTGTLQVGITFTQAGTGLTATKSLTLQIVQSAPVILTAATLPDGSPLLSYSVQLQVAPAPVGKWTLVSGRTPAGISLKESGRLSGATIVPGNYKFTIRFTETSTNLSSQREFFLKIS